MPIPFPWRPIVQPDQRQAADSHRQRLQRWALPTPAQVISNVQSPTRVWKNRALRPEDFKAFAGKKSAGER
jgi:hypothetical protein